MDQLRALHYFIAVAETASFSLAAERFGVPPSSVSRRVADLESALGATLLTRSTRSVRLTEVGRSYLEQVRPLVGRLHQADDSVRSYQTEPMGRLRISSMVGFGESRLLPLLDRFRRLYPKITLDVSLTDEVSVLERDEIDIALRGGYAPNERVVAVRLMANRFHAYAAPAYLTQAGVPEHPLALRRHRGLYFRTPSGPTPWLAQLDGQWQDVSAPAQLISNNGRWLIDQAVRGEGILMVPPWAVAAELEQGQLQQLALTPEVTVSQQADSGGVFLLYQKPRYLVPKIRVAVDYLVQHLQTPA